MTTPLRCYDCGATRPRAAGVRCDCGEPLWIDAEVPASAWSDRQDGRGMWRFDGFLPVDDPGGVGAAAGGTPLVRTERLDAFAGPRTWVKDEGEQPTGSFKDRGSAVAVEAVRGEADAIGTVSHGNMAISTAAHAAAAGLDCTVLVPADVPPERLAILDRYDPEILRVAGSYGQLYHDALAAGPEAGVAFVNSDTPLRVAGQATTTMEILDQFAPGVPDAVVLPVSSGGHASACWTAIRDLERAGVLDATPRLCLVQAAACAPIAEAYRAGESVSAVDPDETVAYSIANPDPPSGDRALAAVEATDGAVTAVSDPEIRAAQAALAERAGLCVETAGAVALAGARRLHDEGVLAADDRAVLVATGSGFAELAAGDGVAPDPPTVDRVDLSAALSSD